MRTHHTRRQFLKNTTLAALGIGAFGGGLAAAPLDSVKIIDTHTHFYDPSRPQGVPWPPKNDALLYRRVLPADYQALPKPQPVAGTVVVEASPWLEDNQWILDLAAREPFIVGFVGNLVPGTDSFAPGLKRLASNPIFRGIRISADPLREGLGSADFLDDLRRLAGRDLSLDLVGGPGMLGHVSRLAEALPDLRIIIDHIAGARVDGGPPDKTWTDGMQRAAHHPNVCCKVSGLVEGTGHSDGTAPNDVAFYKPTLDVVWTAWGPDRLVYGSNWPVSERFAPCAVVQQIVSHYFSAKSPAAAEKVFFANSRRIYKWVDRGQGR